MSGILKRKTLKVREIRNGMSVVICACYDTCSVIQGWLVGSDKTAAKVFKNRRESLWDTTLNEPFHVLGPVYIEVGNPR